MPTDTLLRDAVQAVKTRIQATANGATPEDLAYLGTAIERISANATLLEVEAMGDAKIAAISTHAATVETTARATLATVQAAITQATAAADRVSRKLSIDQKTYFLSQL